MSTCSSCNREHAASYALWQCSDTTCGMSPDWNEDGESHDDCINECLYASRNHLRAQLSLATAEIAALKELAEAVRAVRPLLDIWEFDPDQSKVESLDAAMAKLKGTEKT